MMRLTLLSILAVALVVQPISANPELDAAFPQGSIVVSASRHACYRFDVYMAINNTQWRRGLMNVKSLGRWRGMLFVYADEGERSMWMKNTFLPLDMLFIRGDGAISSIVTNTEPQSLRSITSIEPVRFVLELNAGVTQSLSINAGDAMVWAGEITPAAASQN